MVLAANTAKLEARPRLGAVPTIGVVARPITTNNRSMIANVDLRIVKLIFIYSLFHLGG
jgi:hypothetical protein